jgi:perosamine synthetase
VRFGHNYRMPELTAALGRVNLSRFDELVARRQRQTALFMELVDCAPGVISMPFEKEWNGYGPLFQLTLADPRAFCRRLAELGVANSVGTFELVSADQLPAMAAYQPPDCPRAQEWVNRTLAVVIAEQDDDEQLRALAATVIREARRWT